MTMIMIDSDILRDKVLELFELKKLNNSDSKQWLDEFENILDSHASAVAESDSKQVNDDNMSDCPFNSGLKCNQKKNMCDKGQFEPNCIMLALRHIDLGINANHDYLIREGILHASHVLLHKGHLKGKLADKSSTCVRDLVVKYIDEAKADGKEWHEVGWEFLNEK